MLSERRNIIKKLISTILALLLIFTASTTAFASEADRAFPAAESVESTGVFFGNTDAVLIGSSEETRSTSLPTSYWSLAKNNYTADLQVVGKNWLYTNYYYHPNGDGKIYVDYNIRADTSTTTFYIGLYDLTQDELVVEFTVDDVRTSGKTGSMNFYNLVQSHNYAVCFRAHPSSLNGSAVIRH